MIQFDAPANNNIIHYVDKINKKSFFGTRFAFHKKDLQLQRSCLYERTTMKKLLFIVLFILLTSQVSFAQVYKWVDEKGVTHFTDDMTQLPEKYRPKAQGVQTPQENEDIKPEEEIVPKKDVSYHKDRLGRGEDYWKGLVEEWTRKLREQQGKLEALRARYNELTERHNDSKSIAVRTNLRSERDLLKNEIDQCRKEIEEARSVLEKKIPEEAELYNANPEWVRR